MSGKQKQAHRTKGNVRPSSSARAAEQLANTGTSVPGFIGFGALSDLGYVPASSTNEEADSSVDADFRLVLRKLSKRDSTTKIKALQELSALCQDKDVESVKSVLPFWPRIFSKLSTDNDRRVREACHQTFEQMVQRVRRNLAPHLKSLMGPWIVGQCDVYPPAASAAKSCFQAAFPPAKQNEAVAFCKHEIIGHISDNLLVLTPTTLSDPKTTDKEDMEARYQKVVASSLQGWKMLTTALCADQQEGLNEKYMHILNNAKFWKFAAHPIPMIKGSFYLLIAALCQSFPALANQYSDKICPLVLYHLDESDPAVCPALWEAVLYAVATIPECWEKVNPRKGVLPKLWSMLKTGGNGSAYMIYPNLLPFLSKIPSDVIGDGLSFYKEWFSNMLMGLSDEKVQASKLELSAVVQSVLECMKYALTRHTSDSSDQLAQFILQEKLFVLLEASFVDKANSLSHSPLYVLAADLLLFLDKHEKETIQQSSGLLWTTLKTCIQNHIEQQHTDDNGYTLQRIGKFLDAFLKPVVTLEKKKVKFSEVETPSEPDLTKVIESTPSVSLEKDSPLLEIVNEAGASCLQKARDSDHPSSSHMTLLSSLCNTFGSREFAKHLHAGDTAESTSKFVEDIILPWVKETEDYEQSKAEIFVQGLVDLMLMLYRLGTSSEKVVLLDLLCKSGNSQILVMTCEKVLKMEMDPVIHLWWKGPQFGDAIVLNTTELCVECLHDSDVREGQLKYRWNLLKLALTTQINGEPVIAKEYINKILDSIRCALPQPEKMTCLAPNELDKCVLFVSDVALLLFREMKDILTESTAEDLMLSLFQIFCQEKCLVSDRVLEKVQEAWKLGVTSLIQLKGGLMNDSGFFVRATEHVKGLVKDQDVSCSRLNQLSEKSLELARHIGLVLHEEKTTVLSHPTVQHFVQLLFGRSEATAHRSSQWDSYCVVKGHLTFNCLPKESEVDTRPTVPQDVAAVLFSSNLLVAVVQEDNHVHEKDFPLIVDIAWGIALCDCRMGNMKKLMYRSELAKVCDQLENNLRIVMHNISPNNQTLFVQDVVDKSLFEGGLWSVCLQVVLKQVMTNKWNVIVGSLLNIVDRLSGLVEPVLHTLQVVSPYLSKTELGTVAEVLTAQLLSCEPEAAAELTGGRGFLAGLCVAAAHQENPVGEGGGGVHLDPQVVLSALTQVQLWREQHEDLFLFETDLSQASWGLVSLNVEVMKLLRLLVVKLPAILSEHQWDFILCSLVSWVQTCHESQKLLETSLPHQMFLVHACDLLTSTAACMEHVLPEHSETFPPNLATEWREFFAHGAYNLLLPIYVHLTESSTGLSSLSVKQDAVVRSLCTAVSECPLDFLKTHHLPANLVADHDTSAPDELQSLLNHLCPRLISSNRATQITAYRLLQRVVPDLPAYDSEKEKNSESDQEARSPPPAMMTVLDTCRAAVDLIMGDVLVGEPVIVEAYTEEDVYTRGYLLCWNLLLNFFKAAPSEMRAEYASFLRDLGAVDHLLANLFRFMPENPVIQLQDSLTSASPGQKLSSVMSMFSRDPLLDVAGDNSSPELAHLACSVYHRALQDLPAIVRQWWNSQDKRVAAVVDKFTSKHVTHVLCSEEMEAISKSDVAVEDMTIKTRSAAREVAATYTIQEFTMELVIVLPVNHPLGAVSVESGKRVGVPTNLWRNWMLQMTTFLTHQNGSMLDGLALWKRNVDKKFAGVEECMVCFSVIHPSNYHLPKLQCKVCKKKFHSACLYKWFNTSNNSTCPMCRSLF